VNTTDLVSWNSASNKFKILKARADAGNNKDRESDRGEALQCYYLSCFNLEILEAWMHENTLYDIVINRHCERHGDLIMVEYEEDSFWPAVLVDIGILTDPYYSELYKEYD
jgi:hypothetical protein